jgi:hypothetical protein
VRRLSALLVLAAALLPVSGARPEEAVSAFAANVGVRAADAESAPAVTLYIVPEGRTLLLTDVLVANHGQEMGPLYLADSQRTRCSIELLQNTVVNQGQGNFSTLANVHTSFSTGIPFAAGEPVVATLAGGMRGVDVTVTGRLVRAPRPERPIRLPGGARTGERTEERRSPEHPDE